MGLVIQTNIGSLAAQNNLNKTQSALQDSYNRLSSGFRINSAKDDAAGLAISESLKMQIRSFTVAERNANDGISMSQTAEGALGQISDTLARMRELAMQGSNGNLGSSDRTFLSTEFTQLQSEIQRIQNSTVFNGVNLLSGTNTGVRYQVGLDASTAAGISVTFGSVALTTLVAAGTAVSGTTASASLAALSTIDTALTTVSTARAKYGAAMNRLSTATSNIETMNLNLAAANSRIRDVDVASETATLSRNQVLAQAGAAVLAQANQSPSLAISLLK